MTKYREILRLHSLGLTQQNIAYGCQANSFFTLISDTYETSSMIFTTNKEITDWTEMLGDPVLTTALLDRILHHARCFSLKGESYRLKHPEMFT